MKKKNPISSSIIKPITIAGVCLSMFSSQIQAAGKMNIVFILTDDLRWNSLGCMGNPIVITPNVDKLASGSVRFNNACVTTPIRCCSRASILSGKYMIRNGVRDFKTTIPETKFAETYPGVLRKAGYWTGFVGKYGVGKIRETDFNSVYEGVHWYPLDSNTKVKTVGKAKNGMNYTRVMGDSIHVTDRNANDAIKFLRNRPKDRPFNLSVSFFAPHAQDQHPGQYRYKPSSEKLYQDIRILVPVTSTTEALNALPPFISNEENYGRVRWHW